MISQLFSVTQPPPPLPPTGFIAKACFELEAALIFIPSLPNPPWHNPAVLPIFLRPTVGQHIYELPNF